jgi:fructose-1,6-bisphosphatase I
MSSEVGKNESNDDQKQIDVLSNELMGKTLLANKHVIGYASEEEPTIVLDMKNIPDIPTYFVSFDPLDGSSNVDSNISIGTIFCIFNYSNKTKTTDTFTVEDIVAAGYCLYGPSTIMVLTQNWNTNMYLYNPSSTTQSQWQTLQTNVTMKPKGKMYALNESSKYIYNHEYNKLTDHFISKNYSARWVGSLVADIHRTIIKGGIVMYPSNTKNPNGKIRLLYEAYPMAYIINACDGSSYSDTKPILSIPIRLTNIHQKIPIAYGSKYEMDQYNHFITS